MDDRQGNGPSLGSLIAMLEAERAKLREALAIETAEKITREAHILALNAELEAANRRVSTARKRLGEAREVGSDSQVKAATIRLNQAERVRDHIAHLVDWEEQQALRVGHDQVEEILERTGAVAAAEHAVEKALARRSL